MQNHDSRKPLLFIGGLSVLGTLIVVLSLFPSGRHDTPNGLDPETVRSVAARLAALEAAERSVDETIWAKEILAQQCGLKFEALWDSVNAASNKWDVLSEVSFRELVPPRLENPELLGRGIERWNPSAAAAEPWDHKAWKQFLNQLEANGWRIHQMEVRHNRFETDENGDPSQSVFYLSVHLTNATAHLRAELEGDLSVDWMPRAKGRDLELMAMDESPVEFMRIDASRLVLRTRRGDPVFQEVMYREITPPEKSYFIDPLILYDTDGDGLSEIILAAKNLLLRRQLNGSYQAELLCREPPGLIFTGLFADFNNDGNADFLCVKFEGVYLYPGSTKGTFKEPSRLVWPASERLKYVQALTCGDVDMDGDLDIWLGQYKVPYELGQMPAPYYDANDGHPSYLLINDGQGMFVDATEASNLAELRMRRSYTGSFVDLDDDDAIDLAVVSDFAGVDFYRNDGTGQFRNVTEDWVDDRYGFGMAHSVADFDRDGLLDFLMIGMNSSTADRLNAMGLDRDGENAGLDHRASMTFGNRLFLQRLDGLRFEQTSLGQSIRRSGWSWGCSAFDWDNDGFLDVYVGNGHESKQSVRDYETRFWLHDIFVGNSANDLIADVYFGANFTRTRGRGFSYGGYEKNRLFWNSGGTSFSEIGHLMGVALEQDSRNVVADDVDGDGRADLLVTTFEAWPEVKQTLRVFRNTLENSGNWIGFQLREQGRGVSPVGARIRLRYPGGEIKRQILTGDSFRSQHANTVRFGLGDYVQVESVEVTWTNGRSIVLSAPKINQYHAVNLPRAGKESRLK